MNATARNFADQIERLKRDLAHAEGQLAALRRSCRHRFGPVKSDPIVRPGYRATSPSWHPGRGSEEDYQVYVPEECTPRWTRTCEECGLVEETTKTEQHVTHTPVFPGPGGR